MAARGWNPLALAGLAAGWIATVGNWPLWRALGRLPEAATPRGALFIAAFAVMVGALVWALLACFAWRRAIKPAAIFVVLSAAAGAYFMGAFGVVLDPTMMTNMLQTDAKEAGDLLGPAFFASFAALGLLPALVLARWRLAAAPFARQAARNALAVVAGLGVVALGLAVFFADFSSTMRNHRGLRYLINPVNSYFSLAVAIHDARAEPAGPPRPIGLDARLLPRAPGARPPLLALVIGETARADHFQLNGYARATDPELARLPVVSFGDVTSCGTNTAMSLPCMFSGLGRAGGDVSARRENLLDLAQRAGLAVLWLDNQSGCKGVCDRVPHAQTTDTAPGGSRLPEALCTEGECYDEALLHDLDRRLEALPAERRARGVLLVLHQMGSHGPAYFRRSPPGRKPFAPECETTVLQQCSRETVTNAYDDSIAYTDHVLAETVRWLDARASTYAPSLLYVSDHGESLGEGNIYLHGLPYAIAPREQTHVPMIAWFGADPAAPALACLRARRHEPLSHDHLFHTVLGLLGVRASEYVPSLDAFAACKAP